jgi:large subunit ribosomal protein L6
VLTAKRATEEHRALHGLARALVANAVHGVTSGFKKELNIVGVGYRAELKGKMIAFALGKSHPIEFPIPEGIQVAVEKQTHLIVSGADKGRSARLRTCVRCARPIRTSRRACASPASG